MTNPRVKTSKAEECRGRDESIKIQLAPLGVQIFTCTPVKEVKAAEPKKSGKTADKAEAAAERKKAVKAEAVAAEEKKTVKAEAVAAEKKTAKAELAAEAGKEGKKTVKTQ